MHQSNYLIVRLTAFWGDVEAIENTEVHSA
jgi:hypothetical protein